VDVQLLGRTRQIERSQRRNRAQPMNRRALDYKWKKLIQNPSEICSRLQPKYQTCPAASPKHLSKLTVTLEINQP
jgi:hypothetical protein